MLDQLSPEQKKIIAIGAPVVAVFVLVNVLRKGSGGATTAATTMPVTVGASAPSTDAIGVGQLADFESMVTQSIGSLSQALYAQLGAQADAIANIPAPTTTTIVQPAPTSTPKQLKALLSSWFPEIAPQGTEMAVIGSAGNGQYNAGNLANGAPLYALIDGQWRQNFGRPEDLKAGTSLATLGSLDDYVVMN